MTPADRVKRILAEAVGRDLSSDERYNFLPSIERKMFLTEKQEQWLSDIEKRVFEEGGAMTGKAVGISNARTRLAG